MGVSKNTGNPQIIHFNRVFHYKPSILGYHYFWKHPYDVFICFPIFSFCGYVWISDIGRYQKQAEEMGDSLDLGLNIFNIIQQVGEKKTVTIPAEARISTVYFSLF